MTLETALVLAVPALLVFGIGVRFRLTLPVLLGLLALAWVISWTFILYRVRALGKDTEV